MSLFIYHQEHIKQVFVTAARWKKFPQMNCQFGCAKRKVNSNYVFRMSAEKSKGIEILIRRTRQESVSPLNPCWSSSLKVRGCSRTGTPRDGQEQGVNLSGFLSERIWQGEVFFPFQLGFLWQWSTERTRSFFLKELQADTHWNKFRVPAKSIAK